MTKSFYEKSHSVLDFGLRMFKLKYVQHIVILNVCMKINQNQSINEGDKRMTKSFLKILTMTLTLVVTRILELVQDIVILNVCSKTEGARVMAKFF